MDPPGGIETDRLVLRATELTDATAIFEYSCDPEVTRYLTFPPADSIEQATAFLERCSRVWREGAAFPLAITLIGSEDLIGMIEPRPTDHGVEIAFVLRRSAWNMGYMTEALHAVTDWALDHPNVFRVWAYVDVDNIGSQCVLEKAGFTREGTLHRWAPHVNVSPNPRDAVIFAKWR